MYNVKNTHSYKSYKPDKKYYVITDNYKTVYFAAAGMSEFRWMKLGSKDVLIDTKIMKHGLNQVQLY